MEDLCREQSLTDVTITCGDVSLEAHSLILGASSPILRSILAKGEGKKQTLHFMDMNPYHMQLLLQYMYRGEISVPQIELAPLMASARSLQVKGLCSAGPSGGTPGVNTASGLNIIDPPAISLPPPTPPVHTQATPPTLPTGMLTFSCEFLDDESSFLVPGKYLLFLPLTCFSSFKVLIGHSNQKVFFF